MLDYPIFLQYCSLTIVNKPKVQYDSFIMYIELYHFLPQACLPLSQMYSTHLLITTINLLSADQNLILLNPRLAISAYHTHICLPQQITITTFIFGTCFQGSLRLIYTTLLHDSRKLGAAQPSHEGEWHAGTAWKAQTLPLVCAPGVQSLRMGGWEDRTSSLDIMDLLSTLYSCSWMGCQLGKVNPYDLRRLLYLLIQS